METARYSLKHRASLEEKVKHFAEDPKPGNLAHEVALMRGLLQEYLERFNTGTNPSEQTILTILEMVERIGKMVERVAKIESLTALTQAEVNVLQARFAEIIVRYVDAGKQAQLIEDLQSDPILERGFSLRRQESITIDLRDA